MVTQKYYDLVAAELSSQPPIPGLWARAFAETSGDMQKAKALYIQLRAQELFQKDKDIALTQRKATLDKETEARTLARTKFWERARKLSKEILAAYWILWIVLSVIGGFFKIDTLSWLRLSSWMEIPKLDSSYSRTARIAHRVLFDASPLLIIPILCVVIWCCASLYLAKHLKRE